MAKELFPWQEQQNTVEDQSEATKSNVLPGKITASFKKFLPIYLLLFLVVGIMIFRPVKQRTFDAPAHYLDVLVVMLPIPKGHEVIPETLKAVPLKEKALTKNQALQIVRIEDIAKLRGRLIAKKTLPPNKPLFWSDIEFKNLPQPNKQIPRIFYPKE